MPKLNYIRALIDSLETDLLKDLVEEYAKNDKSFEAFVIEKSGKAVDTGKTYEEYREELAKILKRCTTRRKFVKVTRLKNAGVASFQKMLNSHFKNENFGTALWMSLALMETMQEVVLMNTRYTWANKPYKSFEKILLESRDQFDSSIRFAKIARKDRQQLFLALVRCWWRERASNSEHQYFDAEDLLKYAKRDEDFLALQVGLQEVKPRAIELDKKIAKKEGTWTQMLAGVFESETKPGEFAQLVTKLEKRIKKGLESWE